MAGLVASSYPARDDLPLVREDGPPVARGLGVFGAQIDGLAVGDTCFALGTVVKAGRCAYLEFGMSQPSPYRVKLDGSEVDELIQHKMLPEKHDGYVHAPVDMDCCIRAPKAPANAPPQGSMMAPVPLARPDV